MGLNAAAQLRLVEALEDPRRYPHPAGRIEVIETHISHVLLAGAYAYKIKKALNLGFLDFTCLERRRFYCGEELRLNRRTAPEIYLDCIAIGGTPDNPNLGDPAGPPIEYAVRMRRFDQEALMDRRLQAGQVTPDDADALADGVIALHAAAAREPPERALGAPELILEQALENPDTCARLVEDAALAERLGRLRTWTLERHALLRERFESRRRQGWVRECHGDLHLGNLVRLEAGIRAFDGIEFSPELRWIDCMSDLAFLLMDLRHRDAHGLARRVLDRYLTYGGDHGGLAVLGFYQVYRALVRAKVAALRASQPGARRREALAELRDYLALAEALARGIRPFLLVTHGPSGAGKTHLTGALLAAFDAVRLRSDVERKRLAGLAPEERSDSAPGGGIYTAGAGERTYGRLLALAGEVLDAGMPVLVDATFGERAWRERFRALAEGRGLPFVLLECRAPAAVLRRRVEARGHADASEADLAVLEQQLRDHAPAGPDERPLAADPAESLPARLRARLQEAG